MAYFSNKHYSIIGSLSALHYGRGPKKCLKVWFPSIKFKIQPRGRGIFKRLCFSLIPLFFSSLLVSSRLSIFELGDEVCCGSQMPNLEKNVLTGNSLISQHKHLVEWYHGTLCFIKTIKKGQQYTRVILIRKILFLQPLLGFKLFHLVSDFQNSFCF